jgi:hypothetical protein
VSPKQYFCVLPSLAPVERRASAGRSRRGESPGGKPKGWEDSSLYERSWWKTTATTTTV